MLGDKVSKKLEEHISEKEVLQVPKDMKTSKSTGSDGFTAEFLKFFWNNLKYFLISAINGILIKKTITNITEAWYNFSFTKG